MRAISRAPGPFTTKTPESIQEQAHHLLRGLFTQDSGRLPPTQLAHSPEVLSLDRRNGETVSLSQA